MDKEKGVFFYLFYLFIRVWYVGKGCRFRGRGSLGMRFLGFIFIWSRRVRGYSVFISFYGFSFFV